MAAQQMTKEFPSPQAQTSTVPREATVMFEATPTPPIVSLDATFK
jgi:hypothetical protein